MATIVEVILVIFCFFEQKTELTFEWDKLIIMKSRLNEILFV